MGRHGLSEGGAGVSRPLLRRGRCEARNAISPGWTEDSVLNSLPEQVQTLIRNWHAGAWTPLRRLGTPADVGNVVALFCSDKARWITGQVIHADGGASLMNPEVPPEVQIG